MILDPIEQFARIFITAAQGLSLDAPYVAFENLFKSIGGYNKYDAFDEAVHAITDIADQEYGREYESSLSPAEKQIIEQMRDYLLSDPPQFIPPMLK